MKKKSPKGKPSSWAKRPVDWKRGYTAGYTAAQKDASAYLRSFGSQHNRRLAGQIGAGSAKGANGAEWSRYDEKKKKLAEKHAKTPRKFKAGDTIRCRYPTADASPGTHSVYVVHSAIAKWSWYRLWNPVTEKATGYLPFANERSYDVVTVGEATR